MFLFGQIAGTVESVINHFAYEMRHGYMLRSMTPIGVVIGGLALGTLLIW